MKLLLYVGLKEECSFGQIRLDFLVLELVKIVLWKLDCRKKYGISNKNGYGKDG